MKRKKANTKRVQVDHRTWIEVDKSIPDEKAIENFLKKLEYQRNTPYKRSAKEGK